jgi:O-antigen ligase
MNSRSIVFGSNLIWPSMVLLFLAPAVNLVWRGGTGYCFFALFALALGAAVVNRRTPSYFTPLRTYRWYAVGMIAFVVAIGIQQAVLGYWLPRQLDAVSRFAFALPVFLLLCQLPSRSLRAIGWGCTVGALFVGIWAFFDRPQSGWTDTIRFSNYYTNAIPFGDTALLLAFLSVFTFGWDTSRDWRSLGIRLFALCAGGYASYSSGTRGGWLAIPAFAILLGAQYQWFAHKKRLLIAIAAFIVFVAALLSTGRVEERIAAAATDITLLRQGDTNTSVGIRLQLWNASWNLFTKHPVYGIGKGNLDSTLDRLAKDGKVKPWIINERAHSDFFSTLAEMGLIGVFCLFLFTWESQYIFGAIGTRTTQPFAPRPTPGSPYRPVPLSSD